MRVTTEALSQVTDLLAIVSAPPIETSTVRHIEVLALQPQVADGGGHHLDRRGDQARLHVRRARSTPGWSTGRPPTSTSGWAGSGLGARLLPAGCGTPICRRASRTSSTRSRPPFTELEDTAERHALRRRRRAPARPRTASRTSPSSTTSMEMLERRVACSAYLRGAGRARRLRAHRARERGCRRCARCRGGGVLRAAPAQPGRGVGDRPGANGLRAAIVAVRDAALSSRASSRTSTTAGMRCPTTTTRSSASRATPTRPRSRRPSGALARELHPDVNAHDPAAEEQVQGGRGGLRGAVGRRAAARSTTATATTGCARAGSRSRAQGFGSFADIFDAFFGGGGVRRRRPAAAAPCRAGTSRWRWRSTLAEAAAGNDGRGRSTTRSGPCEHCHGNRAEPGTPIETCESCGGQGQVRAVSASPFGQIVRARRATCAAARATVARSPAASAQGRGREARSPRARRGDPRGHRRRPAHPALRPRARGRARRAARATCTCSCAFARTSASCATAAT